MPLQIRYAKMTIAVYMPVCSRTAAEAIEIARDHFKDVLDAVEGGAAAVIRREKPVVALERHVLDALLADLAPFDVLSSVADEQVAFWLTDSRSTLKPLPVSDVRPMSARPVE